MTHPMTCAEFDALLPSLLDDEVELTPEARHHLDGCDACRSLVADLTAIRAEAAALPLLQPARDLWSGIEARIEAPVVSLGSSGRARRQVSWPMAGIAAAALVMATSAITYQLTRQTGVVPQLAVATNPPPVADTNPAAPEAVVASTSLMRPTHPGPNGTAANGMAANGAVANSSTNGTAANGTAPLRSPAPSRVILAATPARTAAAYDREVARLRAVLDSGRARLDPATVALLERNLTVIDSAIVQCQRALVKDPASHFLIESLNNSYQTKVKLLRIAAAASKG